jgi:hypothetical protein
MIHVLVLASHTVKWWRNNRESPVSGRYQYVPTADIVTNATAR